MYVDSRKDSRKDFLCWLDISPLLSTGLLETDGRSREPLPHYSLYRPSTKSLLKARAVELCGHKMRNKKKEK